MAELTVGSIFAGVAGFDLGLEYAGLRCAWQHEPNLWARTLLTTRWPEIPQYAQSSEIPSTASVDVLVGGGTLSYRNASLEGRKQGIAGAEGRFSKFIAVARRLTPRPTWGLCEYSYYLAGGFRYLAPILEHLRDCWPVVGYRVLDARYFGVAQCRRKLYLVGGPSDESVSALLDLRFAGPLANPTPRTGLVSALKEGPRSGSFVTGHATAVSPDTVVVVDGRARELTPLEGERLQGFPDGWTCLCAPLECYDRDPDGTALTCRCEDAPRYRTLSVAVNVAVATWLGTQLRKAEAIRRTSDTIRGRSNLLLRRQEPLWASDPPRNHPRDLAASWKQVIGSRKERR